MYFTDTTKHSLLRMRGLDRGKQINHKHADAPFAWQVVADERDLANFRAV
jgi:hypothetical protein